jgi:hypothetical protein
LLPKKRNPSQKKDVHVLKNLGCKITSCNKTQVGTLQTPSPPSKKAFLEKMEVEKNT